MPPHRNTFFAALSALLICLATPQSLFANGGDDLIARINISIQERIIGAAKGDRINFSFTRHDLKAMNVRKGTNRADQIARIAARYVSQLVQGTPTTSWDHLLGKGLRHDWCSECRGGTTVLAVTTTNGTKTDGYHQNHICSDSARA